MGVSPAIQTLYAKLKRKVWSIVATCVIRIKTASKFSVNRTIGNTRHKLFKRSNLERKSLHNIRAFIGFIPDVSFLTNRKTRSSVGLKSRASTKKANLFRLH